MVLCHRAGREAVHGYEDFSLPPLPSYVDRYESLAAPVHEGTVVAGALNTMDVDGDDAAREAVREYGDALGLPATDLVRFDPDPVLEAVL